MCGQMNIVDDATLQELMEELGVDDYPAPSQPQAPLFKPSQSTLMLSQDQGQLSASHAQWGIHPSWSKQLLINARSETISEKPSFQAAFQQNRVLIPCQGWYEWKAGSTSSNKDKFLIEPTTHQALLMAAVFYPEQNQFVTLTCQPNNALKTVHHRMPVVINKRDAKHWLSADPTSAKSLFLSEQQNSYKILPIAPAAQNLSLF